MKTQNSMPKTLILLLLLYPVLLVRGGDNKVIIGEKVTLHSSLLNEDRTILVHMPTGYDLSDARYPVIYLLDGETHFAHATGTVQFLSGQGLIPPAIVVGIVNVDRGRDFTPTKIEKKPNTGGAPSFLGFIEKELMPYMDENYRTQPFQVIVGHSLGGTFATWMFLEYPSIFEGYVAISPYLAYDENLLITKAGKMIPEKYGRNLIYYMTVGNEPEYYETLSQFAKIIQQASPEGLQFDYVQMEDETHSSTPLLSVYQGLEAIYPDWQIPQKKYEEGLAAIDNHYAFLSEKYGYTIETPEYVVNLLGYQLLKNNAIDQAILVFEENVKRYPKSANVYDSLGEAFENDGQPALARKNYEKAVKIAQSEHHPYLATYEANLNRIHEMVAGK